MSTITTATTAEILADLRKLDEIIEHASGVSELVNYSISASSAAEAFLAAARSERARFLGELAHRDDTLAGFARAAQTDRTIATPVLDEFLLVRRDRPAVEVPAGASVSVSGITRNDRAIVAVRLDDRTFYGTVALDAAAQVRVDHEEAARRLDAAKGDAAARGRASGVVIRP